MAFKRSRQNHSEPETETVAGILQTGNSEDGDDPEQEIVNTIRQTRKKMKMTQTELARRTGIDQGDISKLEHGSRNPSIKLLKRLARGLDMDLKIEFVPRKEQTE